MARAPLLEIERLALAVPGLAREEARQLGHDVARLLAEGDAGERRGGRLGQLRVAVRIPPGTPKHRLAEIIAGQIGRSLP